MVLPVFPHVSAGYFSDSALSNTHRQGPQKRKNEEISQQAPLALRRCPKKMHFDMDFSSKKLTNIDVRERVIPFLRAMANRYIISLDISKNHITAYGARLLSEIEHLRSLNISHNPIGDRGALALAESRGLKELTANVCEIGLLGAAAFVKNKTLTHLHLYGNRFDPGKQIVPPICSLSLKALDLKREQPSMFSLCNIFHTWI